MVELEQRGAAKLHPLVGREAIQQHAARDLDPDRLIGSVVEQEVEGDLVKEVGGQPGALAEARQRPDRSAPAQRRRGGAPRDHHAAHRDRLAIGDRAQLGDVVAPVARDQAVQPVGELHAQRPRRRRERGGRRRRRDRHAELVARHGQHAPGGQPGRRGGGRRGRDAHATRERDPARERTAGAGQRRRLALGERAPAGEDIQEARDRTVELHADPTDRPVLPRRRAGDVAGDGRAVPLADLFRLADHQVAFAHRPRSIVTRPEGACTS